MSLEDLKQLFEFIGGLGLFLYGMNIMADGLQKAAGGRMIPLKVKGGFHSPFMETAAAAFREELSRTSIKAPELPVYANRTAEPYPGEGHEAEVRELLGEQIVSPVQWEQTIRNMIAAGADTFVEIGPGETLCGMIKRIDKNVRTFAVEDRKGLEAVKAELLS